MKLIGVSEIYNNGEQYISGLLEEEKFDDLGLWNGVKAFIIDVNHKKQTSMVRTFIWLGGTPRNYKTIKVYKDEVVSVQETERILKECNLI